METSRDALSSLLFSSNNAIKRKEVFLIFRQIFQKDKQCPWATNSSLNIKSATSLLVR